MDKAEEKKSTVPEEKEYVKKSNHFLLKKQTLGLIVLLLLLISIPLTSKSVQEVQDNRQRAQTPTPSPTLTSSQAVSTNVANGLLGTYYNEKDFTGTSVSRIDSNINFVWWFGPPVSGIHEDTFSIRWTGQIQPKYSEDYTFYLRADEGVRLWVNNQLLIDKWVTVTQATDYTATTPIKLEAGKKYDIKLEYFENFWWEEVILSWSSASQPKQVVPQGSLFTNYSPETTASNTNDPFACVIKEAKLLPKNGSGDFSPDDSKLAFHKKDAQGVYQIFTSKPDGTDEKCITCTQVAGAPRVDRHKIAPMWHASGKYLIINAEMDTHPATAFSRIGLISELFINGLWSNIYVLTPDGQKWYQLTDYSNKSTDGAMHVNFSPDGTKVTWSRLRKEAGGSAPWGLWNLMIADFVVDAQGVPSLQNIQDITPANGQLLEAHGFSPDNSKVIFTGDMERTHSWDMDQWTKDIKTGTLQNLTKGIHWEEHGGYSPSGKKIAYMSSEVSNTRSGGTEMMIMNADGSDKRQITHFNSTGYLESTVDQTMATSHEWNSDGTKMAVVQQYTFKYPNTNLWIFTFAGKCGE